VFAAAMDAQSAFIGPQDGSGLETRLANLSAGEEITLRANTRYTLSQGYEINVDGVTISGPRSAVVEFQSGSGIEDTMFTIGGSASAQRTRLAGFTIDCSNQATPTNNFVEDTDLGHGVFLDDSAGVGVQQSVVDGVRVLNASNEGIAASGRSIGAQQLRSTVRNCIVEGAGTRGIHPHNDHSLKTINNWVIGGGTDADGNDVAIRHSETMIGNTVIGGQWRYALYGSDYQTVMGLNTVVNSTLENEAVRTWTGGTGVDHLLYNHVYGVNSGAFRIRNRARLEVNAAWRCDGDSFIVGAPCQIDGFIAHEPGNRGVYVPGGAADGATIKNGWIIDPAWTNNNGRGMQNDGGAVEYRDIKLETINNGGEPDEAIREFNDPDTNYEEIDASGFNAETAITSVGANARFEDNSFDDYVSSIPFTAPSVGDWYYDDGTNTGSGTRGKRVYDGTAWVDVWTL
jgi:hypothetical protein